jgi:hypothetical protein
MLKPVGVPALKGRGYLHMLAGGYFSLLISRFVPRPEGIDRYLAGSLLLFSPAPF